MNEHLDRARGELADQADQPSRAELQRDEDGGGYDPNRHPNGLLILDGETPGKPWPPDQRLRVLRGSR